MSIEQRKERVRTLYEEVFNQRNLDIIDEIGAPGFVDHDSTNPAGNVEGVKQWFRTIHNAFPDLRVTIEDMMAEDDQVVVRYRTKGTHAAEFMGIGPTGREISGTGIDILRFEGDKIAEHWGEFDNLGMMRQLGVIPEQPGASFEAHV